MNGQIRQIAERIRDLREIFAKTTAQMAEAIGVSEEKYKQLEGGGEDFSFTVLQNIAQVYGVDVIELITGESPTLSGFEVVRAGEGAPLERRSGFKYLHLASMFKNKSSEPFMVTALYPGETADDDIPVGSHDGEEFDLVVQGALKVKLGGKIETLREGDSVYYNSAIPHGMAAAGGECKFLAVVMNPRGEALKYTQPVAAPKAKRAAPADDGLIFRRFADAVCGDSGSLVDITFKPNDNFNFSYDVVDALGAQYPGKRAMLWLSREKDEKDFTFGDMARYSSKTANYFTSLGITKGDKVLLVLKRHYEFWFAILALHKIGAAAIPATHLLTQHDFEYRFNAAGVKAIVCTGNGTVAAEADKAIANCPQVKVEVMAQGKRDGWRDFTSGVEAAPDSFARVQNSKDDIMLMFFTSGTTGYPKIAAHSFTYPLGHITTAKYWQNVQRGGLHFTISDTGWGKSLWGKLYGQWLCEAAVFTYDFDKFDAADILPLFKRYNITTFCAPPTMYRFFIKSDLDQYDLSSLKYAAIAGEALNPEVFEQFKKATGLSLMEGFGQTELTITIANWIGMTPKPGSMGKPSPQYHVEIIGGDGKPTKAGEAGEIVLGTDKQTCGLFLGYYQDEEKTREAIHDGYYHTGDVAYKDEDGYYWYVGRTDDLIKSSGYRIGPFEIESVIMELPYVLECAVTGVPDPVRGQLVKATIVLTKGTTASEQLKKDIQDYVKTHTAPYKYPRVVEFVEALPKTISGKIRRVEIRGAK